MARVARPTIQWYKSAVNTTTITFTDGNGDPYDLSGFDSFKVVHYASYSSTAVQELTFSRASNVFTVEPDSAELAEFKKGVNVLEFQFISNSKDLPNVYTAINIELATAFAGSTNNISATTAISANEVTVEVTEAKAISTVTLQSTDGLEKTYRITFTDGTTFDYVVTDGADGSDALTGVETVNALGSISGANEIDLSLGSIITATLTGAVTLSFTGLPSAGEELTFALKFSGAETITWPAGTEFAGGSAPSITGPDYELPCSIDSGGTLTVYGVIDEIASV